MLRFFLNRSIIVLLIISAGCTDYQDIEFLGIQDIRVDGIGEGEIKVLGKAVFRNPNSRGFRLRGGEINVFARDKQVAVIKPAQRVKIKGNAEFEIPVDMDVRLQDSGILGNIIGLIGGKKLELRFEGQIKFSRGIIFSQVHISDTGTLKL